MYTLTSWLMRAKRAPWKTSAVGQSWRESGQRYLQIAPWLQCPALFVVMSLTKSPPQANEDDSLMQLFGPNILKEFLVMRRLLAVVMLSFSFPLILLRNGFPADLGSRESFEKVCEILGNATRPLCQRIFVTSAQRS